HLVELAPAQRPDERARVVRAIGHGGERGDLLPGEGAADPRMAAPRDGHEFLAVEREALETPVLQRPSWQDDEVERATVQGCRIDMLRVDELHTEPWRL